MFTRQNRAQIILLYSSAGIRVAPGGVAQQAESWPPQERPTGRPHGGPQRPRAQEPAAAAARVPPLQAQAAGPATRHPVCRQAGRPSQLSGRHWCARAWLRARVERPARALPRWRSLPSPCKQRSPAVSRRCRCDSTAATNASTLCGAGIMARFYMVLQLRSQWHTRHDHCAQPAHRVVTLMQATPTQA